MAIFRRDPDTPVVKPAASTRGSRPAGETAEVPTTRIVEGTRIEGEISGSAGLLVDGEVQGQIRLGVALAVGPQGVVMGEVEARTVRIAGRVEGSVHGHERVEILASGVVEGDVVAPRVVIENGAFLRGKVEMGHDAAEGRRSGTGEGSGAGPLASEKGSS